MSIPADSVKIVAPRAASHMPRGAALVALPLLLPALSTPFVTADQALWLIAALYAAWAVAGPTSGAVLKACEVLGASMLCTLALVNPGA